MNTDANLTTIEVVLKKTKITANILKQTQLSSFVSLNAGEVLGWCVYEKKNVIVCYESNIQKLSIFPLFSSVTQQENHRTVAENERFEVIVSIDGNGVPLIFKFATCNTANIFTALLQRAKHQAVSRGQFFL